MKNILVPVDFSPVSRNAYAYAKELGKHLEAKLTVRHYWHPDADAVATMSAAPSAVYTEELERSLAAFTGTDKVKSELVPGLAATSIEEASKDFDMIVMGNTGDGGVLEEMFGSIASHVSRQAHCPVWLIPPGGRFKGLKKIMFASDFETASDRILEEIVKLGHAFGSDIHLVHVNEDKSAPATDVKSRFAAHSELTNISLHTLQNDSVWDGLEEFAKENGINLSVVVTKHRSFWENLWHSSTTKEIVLQADTPLVVLHTDEEESLV